MKVTDTNYNIRDKFRMMLDDKKSPSNFLNRLNQLKTCSQVVYLSPKRSNNTAQKLLFQERVRKIQKQIEKYKIVDTNKLQKMSRLVEIFERKKQKQLREFFSLTKLIKKKKSSPQMSDNFTEPIFHLDGKSISNVSSFVNEEITDLRGSFGIDPYISRFRERRISPKSPKKEIIMPSILHKKSFLKNENTPNFKFNPDLSFSLKNDFELQSPQRILPQATNILNKIQELKFSLDSTKNKNKLDQIKHFRKVIPKFINIMSKIAIKKPFQKVVKFGKQKEMVTNILKRKEIKKSFVYWVEFVQKQMLQEEDVKFVENLKNKFLNLDSKLKAKIMEKGFERIKNMAMIKYKLNILVSKYLPAPSAKDSFVIWKTLIYRQYKNNNQKLKSKLLLQQVKCDISLLVKNLNKFQYFQKQKSFQIWKMPKSIKSLEKISKILMAKKLRLGFNCFVVNKFNFQINSRSNFYKTQALQHFNRFLKNQIKKQYQCFFDRLAIQSQQSINSPSFVQKIISEDIMKFGSNTIIFEKTSSKLANEENSFIFEKCKEIQSEKSKQKRQLTDYLTTKAIAINPQKEPVKFEFKKRSRVDSINSRYSKNSDDIQGSIGNQYEIKPGGTPIFSPQKSSTLFGAKGKSSTKYEEYIDDDPVFTSQQNPLQKIISFQENDVCETAQNLTLEKIITSNEKSNEVTEVYMMSSQKSFIEIVENPAPKHKSVSINKSSTTPKSITPNQTFEYISNLNNKSTSQKLTDLLSKSSKLIDNNRIIIPRTTFGQKLTSSGGTRKSNKSSENSLPTNIHKTPKNEDTTETPAIVESIQLNIGSQKSKYLNTSKSEIKLNQEFNPKPFRNTFVLGSPSSDLIMKSSKRTPNHQLKYSNSLKSQNSKESRPPYIKKVTMEIPDEFPIKENKFKKYFEKPYKIPCNKNHMFQNPQRPAVAATLKKNQDLQGVVGTTAKKRQRKRVDSMTSSQLDQETTNLRQYSDIE